ncbi:uncharacterized protein LOC125206878 [Salvia hispanica]|uniref:uncharacterized protein LOC125206878 n=1 Tax=Salvia hispanica TaxID=49212 RepID=UPI00200918C0|nr:uncharacterized protein LOC125206878 [Salvia hispanica]
MVAASRGLPHAHILLFLSKEDKQPDSRRIDEIISAKIPDAQAGPYYYANVKEFMVHGPCGIVRKSSPCMANGRCTKYFPKRCKDNGRVILKDGVPLDNRFVVPHNRFLLLKYGGHINVEWCNQSRSIKYLFKYINKGYDRVTTSFFETGSDGVEKIVDEPLGIIFGYDIQHKDPGVERLSFHLPNEQYVVFEDSEPLERVVNRNTVRESQFLAWMETNKKFVEGRNLTYAEFPTKFVWNTDTWTLRKQRYSIGRLFYVPPGSGDMYYLRCLLNVVRGATSYEDIKCVNGIQYATFRDACYALGLLDDDREYIDGITEASFWASAHSIRLLFEALAREHLIYVSKFTDEQHHVYDTIMFAIDSNHGGLFFVYGYGGTGKTFIWKTLSAAIRSKGDIVLNVDSSGIASLLLPGGRTAHSRFKIPINPNEDSICNIKQGSALAELIVRAKLIIWDEAPMVHKHCVEAVDQSLRDLMRVCNELSMEMSFGGKTVVLGGDFRQILPVVPKGSRQDIVNATINSSYLYLWDRDRGRGKTEDFT